MEDIPRQLSLLDALAIVVGTASGPGIILLPNLVPGQVPSPPLIVAAWVAAGLVALSGALAYAELCTMMPETGGQYIFLRDSYGQMFGFACGWTFFFAVPSSAISWLAVSFSAHLSSLVPLSAGVGRVVSVLFIAILTYVNYRSLSAGAAVQKIFTLLKLAGLAFVIVAAFRTPGPSNDTGYVVSASTFGAAAISFLLAYDGWAAVTFIAGEVRNPQRNIPLALSIGLGACIPIYTLASLALLRAGARLGAVFALIAIVSAVSAANGWTMTAPGNYFAQARDRLFFRRFAEIHPRYGTPFVAIWMQGVWAATLALFFTHEGRMAYASFLAWFFYGMTALGVLVLRRRYPHRQWAYRMPGYPITLFVFLAVVSGLLIHTIVTAPKAALTGVLMILSGVAMYYIWRRFLR